MKKRLLSSLLLLLLILQGACSFSYSYVVVNSSKEPITVELRFKKDPRAEERKKNGYTGPEFRFVELELKRLEDLQKQIAWQPVAANQVVKDEARGQMLINLQPGEALKLHQDSGTARRARENSPAESMSVSYFPIAAITLTGKAGRMIFEGDLVYWQFKEFTKSLYQIRYD